MFCSLFFTSLSYSQTKNFLKPPDQNNNCLDLPTPTQFIQSSFSENFENFNNEPHYDFYSAKNNRENCGNECLSNITTITPTVNTGTIEWYSMASIVSGPEPLSLIINNAPFSNINTYHSGSNALRLNNYPVDNSSNPQNNNFPEFNLNSVNLIHKIAGIYTVNFESADIDSVSFWYAPFLMSRVNPIDNHCDAFFRATLIDLSDNKTIFRSFIINASSNTLSQFTLNTSQYPPSYASNLNYSNWTNHSFDIPTNRRGHKIQLQFMASDCNQSLHKGYVYIDDIETSTITPCNLVADYSDTIDCNTQQINLTGINTGTLYNDEIYEWKVNGTTISNNQNTTYNAPSNGNYSVEFIIKRASNQNCVSSKTKTININCLPPECLMIPTFSYITRRCTTTFTGQNIGTSYPNEVYTWEVNDNGTIFSGTGLIFSHHFSQTGDYTITFSIARGNSDCIKTETVHINCAGSMGPTPCTSSKIHLSGQNISYDETTALACNIFAANIINTAGINSVVWTYSIGGYTDVFISNQTSANNSFFTPIYSILQPVNGNWSNYELWIHADLTLTNGSTCRIKRKITLQNCGGGNYFRMYPNPINKKSILNFDGLNPKEIISP